MLNASNPEAAEKVLGAWDRRLERDHEALESEEDDPEILLFIPFTSDVKVSTL